MIVGYVQKETNKKPDPNLFESATHVLIVLLIDLNKYKYRLKHKILSNSFCFNSSQLSSKEKKKRFLDAVNINSFKGSYSKNVAKDYQLTTKTLTKKEYEEIINKIE